MAYVFHRTLDSVGVGLLSSDDVCSGFNGAQLALPPPLFDGLFKIPPPTNTTRNRSQPTLEPNLSSCL
ncbi:hypothetical protein Q8F55_006079 [Vanrija albida]|uniref:Uncharacterized protein n=1 Tax=Vanrija albida TaxID=181172 RepID=A0ABR3Q467_9TREE